MRFHRIKQVVKYGWQHAGEISEDAFDGKNRISLFFDIFGCYRKYGMWSNQYLKERFWELKKDQRATIGDKYCEANQKKELWLKDFYDNRKFLAKWSKYEIETSASNREKRDAEYTRRYSMGKDCHVEYGVEFSRQHHLPGTISIGNRCLFAKKIFIDYSGEVIIEDNVKIASGVIIESHSHTYDGFYTNSNLTKKTIPKKLVIEDSAVIGANTIILETCGKIGRGARIGAGTVIRCDIPPYAVVTGNPAKIVGFVFSPSILEEYEEEFYQSEERISIDEYEANYKKYYLDRLTTIKGYISL